MGDPRAFHRYPIDVYDSRMDDSCTTNGSLMMGRSRGAPSGEQFLPFGPPWGTHESPAAIYIHVAGYGSPIGHPGVP